MPKTLLLNQNVQLSSPNPNIDWSRGDTFYLDTTTNETFTFSNVTNGRTIVLTVRNNDAAQHTVTFPAGVYKEDFITEEVDAMTENVYTLISSNDKIYIAEVKGLTNA